MTFSVRVPGSCGELVQGWLGGAPFLGISKPVFKAHGSSDAYAIRSAVKQAIAYVNADVVGEIQRNIDNMTL